MSISVALLFMAFGQAADYVNPHMLIEAAELLKKPAGLVVDVRNKQQYLTGHVPDAVWIDASAWGKAFAPAPDAEAWSKRFGAAGIDPESPIILCGGDDVRDPARIWWILRYWGVKDVRLLNGGWSAWNAAGGPAETAERHAEPKAVKLAAQRERLATKDQMLELIKGGAPQILDTRSTAEFCGDAKTAKRNGSIPGATHLEWTESIDPKTKKFKSSAELRKLLQDHNIDVNKPAVTYCQSGGRASVMAFTLELMGGKQVRNYYQSWSEWGNDPATPVVKPTEKK